VATTASIKVIKSSIFKGGVRRWSNRYHFNGTTPPDSAHWTTLSDAVVTAEKAALKPTATIVETIGYAPGSDVPVFSKTYSTVGTDATGGNYAPGEVAGLVRYSTTQRTSKNHPVYLFNYYHNMITNPTAGSQDLIAAGFRTNMLAYANAWVSGFSDGAVNHIRSGPNGAVAQGAFVEEYLTHRDFPYSPSA
jgi:hypothetical protein